LTKAKQDLESKLKLLDKSKLDSETKLYSALADLGKAKSSLEQQLGLLTKLNRTLNLS